MIFSLGRNVLYCADCLLISVRYFERNTDLRISTDLTYTNCHAGT